MCNDKQEHCISQSMCKNNTKVTTNMINSRCMIHECILLISLHKQTNYSFWFTVINSWYHHIIWATGRVYFPTSQCNLIHVFIQVLFLSRRSYVPINYRFHNMFFFGWDELGAHFYSYWGCTRHFSGFLTWNFNIL